jgi:hypothetical protein
MIQTMPHVCKILEHPKDKGYFKKNQNKKVKE